MRVMSFPFLMPSGRQPGLESPSDQGRGTKWSVAPEGVWQREGRRALERRGRETQGSLEQRKRPTLWVGRLPPGPGTERPIPGSKVEGSRPSGLALCPRRSLWRVQRSGIPTLSAPAAGTAASCLPGTLLAGFFPAEVWRNSRQVLTRRSRTAEWRDGTLLPEPAEEEESRPGTTQQRSCVRRRTACTALRLPAGFLPSHSTDAMRGCTLRPRTPLSF